MSAAQSDPNATAAHVPEPPSTVRTAVHTDSAPAGAPPASSGERYRLGNEIARGGMGAVYRAEDTVLGREVAVKVLLDHLTGTRAAHRFDYEARITSRLQHPSIPPIHDLGILPDGRPFLAMKLIRGKTLAEKIATRRGPADDFDEFARIFEQICHAVAFAHSRKVIHRDLKPGNVMVGAFGEVQVMDWGIAKELSRPGPDPGMGDDAESGGGAGDRTRAGSIMGTPAYMPPEQARGDIDRVNERADVFALGGILCAILTGFPPYVGPNSRAVVNAAAAGDLADARQRLDRAVEVFNRAGVTAGPLIQIARRCLTPDPEARPAHAGEVAAAVGAARSQVRQMQRRAEVEESVADAERSERNAVWLSRFSLAFAFWAVLGAFVAGMLVGIYALRTG